MKDWKPRVNTAVNLTTLKLTMEAGFILSRLDGRTRVGELALLTGLSEIAIKQALVLLLAEGALHADDSPDELRAAPEAPEPEVAAADVADEPVDEALLEAVVRGDYRKVYLAQFAAMLPGERAQIARTTSGDLMNALCFDPSPAVLKSLFENERANVTHARLVAVHHRTVAGLEMVVRNALFLRDTQVRRLMLRNPVVTEPILKRLYATTRLGEIFRVVQGHEVTEQGKRALRNLLRERFSASAPESKAEFILSTEGRALALLIGLALDGATTALLCARNFTSLILIQNIARWPATPSTLLRHLLNQPLVNRSPGVKALLLRHPNMPSELKER